jgi:hypothetical protein
MAIITMSSIRVLPRALWTVFLLAALAFVPTPSRASVTFTGSAPGNNPGETNSASVSFYLFVSGTITNLEVTLSNTATYKPNDPADILTALFFKIDGDPSLIRGSAVLGGGSMVVNIGANPQPAGGVVGGEWAYLAGLTHAPLGDNQGISATGLNIFGPHDLFPGPSLPGLGGNPPDGVGYGLTTSVDDGSRYNGGLLGRALIQGSVVFTLFDVPGDFQLSDISDPVAQYGTSLNEQQLPLEVVPEPNTVALTAIGVLFLGLLNRKRH